MKEDKRVEALRSFFRVTNAVFNMQKEISKAFSGHNLVYEHPAATLHRLALNEIEKESPNMSMIDKYLELMEVEGKQNSDST